MAALLALSVSAAYADAPIMVNVIEDILPGQEFKLDENTWFQFNNQTDPAKILEFTVTVADNSPYPVNIQCGDRGKPEKVYIVAPGNSQTCRVNQHIRLAGSSDLHPEGNGFYSIKVLTPTVSNPVSTL